MAPSRTRPPYAADERTQLTGWLDLQRAIGHLGAMRELIDGATGYH